MPRALTPTALWPTLWGVVGLGLPMLGMAAPVDVLVRNAQGQALQDAVVMWEPVGTKVTPKPLADVEVGQRGRQFEPLVSVVTPGTAVHFPNRDTVRHHVYSFSPAKKFEIKLYVGRPEKPIVFDRAGVVVLGCNIHDQMVGWVVVSDSPWWAITDARGQGHVADLAPGTYRVRTWHPQLPVGAPALEQGMTVGSAPATLTVQLP